MAPPLQEIIDKLRLASVQHGAALKQIIDDIRTLGLKQQETEANLAQLAKDIQAALGGAVVDEAGEKYADEEDEEDAEYEEAGG